MDKVPIGSLSIFQFFNWSHFSLTIDFDLLLLILPFASIQTFLTIIFYTHDYVSSAIFTTETPET